MPLYSKACRNIILYLSLSLIGVKVYAEDLASLLQVAMEADTTLRQVEETKLATLELLPQARADLLPLISASANTAYSHTNNSLLRPGQTFSYGATLSQPIINFASWFRYEQANELIKAAIATYEDAKQDLIVRVTGQYFNILKVMDDLNFARAQRKTFAEHLNESRQKYNASIITITDVSVAQAKYDGAAAQEITAENEVYNQKEIMGQITGTPIKSINTLKNTINFNHPKPDNMEHWVQSSILQNYALQSKRFEMEAARNNKFAQSSGHLPTLLADGSITTAKSSLPTQIISNTNSIGLTLSIPIFSSGKTSSKTRQAVYQYELSKQRALEIERQVTSNVRQSYRGVLTHISQIKALQQSVISGQSALDATQAAFEAGTRTILDVLNAQSDLLNNKRNLSKARYDYILANFKLKYYASILQIDDVNAINKWLH